MKNNKLLITTALVGGLLAGSAHAEIKGDIESVLAFGSDESGTTGTGGKGSDFRIGSEANLAYKNKIELNNGAYFNVSGKVELDDAHDVTNNYDHEYEVQYGVGNFYLGLGSDSGKANLAATALPLVGGEYPGTAAGQVGPASSKFVDHMGTTGATGTQGGEANDKAHISANITGLGGVFGITYAPSTGEQDDDTDNVDDATGGSRTGITYVGKPVDGLSVVIGQTVAHADTNSLGGEITTRKLGLGYDFGGFTAAVERQTHEREVGTDVVAATRLDMTGTAFEVAFAAADNITLGAGYAITKDDVTANAKDEKIMSLSIGYDLGGMGLTASYVDATDVDNTSGADQKGVFIRTKAKF